MSDPMYTLATVAGLAAPVTIAILAARRRGDPLPAQIAAIALGLGAALVGIWYAATALGLGTISVAVGGLSGAAVLALGWSGPGAPREPTRRGEVFALLAAGLVLAAMCVVPFVPYGLERDDGIQRLSMTDWEKHLMFATELATFDDVPPRNPFLRDSGPAPYYAGFQLLGAVVARAGGGADAVYGSLLSLTLLTVLLLPFVVWTAARALGAEHRTAVTAAIGATMLGGFDLVALGLDALGNIAAAWPLPEGLTGLREVVPSINPDYWNHHDERQFYPPYRNAIWAPQHLLGALLATLVVAGLWRQQKRERALSDGLALGVAMVATAMLSAYSAIALGVGLAAAGTWALLRSETGARLRALPVRWLAAGLTALLLGLPFATQLSGSGSAGLTLALSAAGGWRNGAVFSSLLGDGTLARLLDTPAVLMFELGALGLLGVAWIGRRRSGSSLGDGRLAAFLVAVVILAVLLRPPVDGPNNLYPRALMLVWLLLAPFAASVARDSSRRVLALLLAPCLLYAPYAMVGATLEGYLFWSTPRVDFEVAGWLGEATVESATVAIDPEHAPIYLTYWVRRPVVYHDERLALLFGASEQQVRDRVDALRNAYGETRPSVAARAFVAMGADQVVVRTDSRAARAWAASPCFITGYRSERWLVVSPEPEACER